MGADKINLLNKGVIMTRNLSVWNSLRPFSVGFDSIFDEFDRMLESTERYNTNYPPYNIHRVDEHNYKIEVALAGYSKDCLLYTSPSPRDVSTSRMPSSA